MPQTSSKYKTKAKELLSHLYQVSASHRKELEEKNNEITFLEKILHSLKKVNSGLRRAREKNVKSYIQSKIEKSVAAASRYGRSPSETHCSMNPSRFIDPVSEESQSQKSVGNFGKSRKNDILGKIIKVEGMKFDRGIEKKKKIKFANMKNKKNFRSQENLKFKVKGNKSFRRQMSDKEFIKKKRSKSRNLFEEAIKKVEMDELKQKFQDKKTRFSCYVDRKMSTKSQKLGNERVLTETCKYAEKKIMKYLNLGGSEEKKDVSVEKYHSNGNILQKREKKLRSHSKGGLLVKEKKRRMKQKKMIEKLKSGGKKKKFVSTTIVNLKENFNSRTKSYRNQGNSLKRRSGVNKRFIEKKKKSKKNLDYKSAKKILKIISYHNKDVSSNFDDFDNVGLKLTKKKNFY